MFVLPPLEFFIKALDKVVKFATEHSRFLKMAFLGLAAVLGGSFLMSATKAVTMVGAITKAVTGLAKATRALWVLFANNPIGWVVTAVMGLILVIEDMYAFFTGAPSVVGVLWKSIQSAFEKAKQIVVDWFTSVLEYFTNFGTQIKDAISGWFDGVANFFGGIFGGGGEEKQNNAGGVLSPAAQGLTAQMATASPSSTTNNNSSVQVQAYITTPADPQKVGEAVGNQTRNAINNANNMITNKQTGVVQKG